MSNKRTKRKHGRVMAAALHVAAPTLSAPIHIVVVRMSNLSTPEIIFHPEKKNSFSVSGWSRSCARC